MSVQQVKKYFEKYGKADDVKELTISTATVELAAKAVGVISARIAKTLSFKIDDACILIVTAGDTKIDNKKYKNKFNTKAKMLTPDEVVFFTGHAIGGVCPFAIENSEVSVFTDVSLKRFETVFPAAGSSQSMIELTCDELFEYSNAQEWIDVCKFV
ncbi:MAG: YbaK/EbsC family protein [Eubacterium sp.]